MQLNLNNKNGLYENIEHSRLDFPLISQWKARIEWFPYNANDIRARWERKSCFPSGHISIHTFRHLNRKENLCTFLCTRCKWKKCFQSMSDVRCCSQSCELQHGIIQTCFKHFQLQRQSEINILAVLGASVDARNCGNGSSNKKRINEDILGNGMWIMFVNKNRNKITHALTWSGLNFRHETSYFRLIFTSGTGWQRSDVPYH